MYNNFNTLMIVYIHYIYNKNSKKKKKIYIYIYIYNYLKKLLTKYNINYFLMFFFLKKR